MKNYNFSVISHQSSVISFRRRRVGFTLIELLIYFGLFSIVTLIITTLFFDISRFWAFAQKTDALQDNARTIFTNLTQTIRSAQNVNSPQIGQTSSFLELNNQTTKFYLEDKSLKRNDQGTINGLINNQVEIDNLEFTRIQNPDGKPTVQIKATLKAKTILGPEEPETLNFQTTVSLR